MSERKTLRCPSCGASTKREDQQCSYCRTNFLPEENETLEIHIDGQMNDIKVEHSSVPMRSAVLKFSGQMVDTTVKTSIPVRFFLSGQMNDVHVGKGVDCFVAKESGQMNDISEG